MDLGDKLASFGLLFSGSLWYLFKRMLDNRMTAAEKIKDAQPLNIKNLPAYLDRQESKCVEYGTLEGIVDTDYVKLQSTHGNIEGVIKHINKVEHKSKRVQGYWSDAKRIIQNTIDISPFKLVDPRSKASVRVMEAESADLLQDELTVTFDHFEPGQSSLLQSGIDRIFGEVSKGIQDTEKMLLVGTNIRAIGRVYMEEGQTMVGPPSDGTRYILTKLSLGAVVRKFESQAFVYKVLTIVCGSISVGLLLYLVVRFYRRYKDYRRNRAVFAEIRAANENNGTGRDEDPDIQCVVCLVNRRNVIIMDCRHVCVCSDCAELLPDPKKCPVCRNPVTQFLPLYNA